MRKKTKKRTSRKNVTREFNMKKWISPIPRKIHFIWIGTNPLPDYFERFLKGFHKLNPEFEIKVWRNKDVTKKNFPKVWSYLKQSKKLQGDRIKEYTNAYTMYNTKDEPYTYNKYAQQTDLLRLELIYNEGGYYFDTTFECLKPLYSLFNTKAQFIGCNEVPRFKDFYALSNSFFGATKGNPILRRLLAKNKLDNIDFRSANVAHETGPVYLRSGIRLSDNYKILPMETMYPYVEEYSPGEDPPYRKAGKDKCHSRKKTKRKRTRLKNKKGYLEIPCKAYPHSHLVKHWVLGKSWLIDHYYVKDGSTMKQVGGVAPCVPCAAVALSNPVGAGIAAAGACTYGAVKAYKCIKKKLTKKKKKKKNKKK